MIGCDPHTPDSGNSLQDSISTQPAGSSEETAIVGRLPQGSSEWTAAEAVRVERQQQDLPPLAGHEILQRYARLCAATAVKAFDHRGGRAQRPDQAALQEVKKNVPAVSRLCLQVVCARTQDQLLHKIATGPASRSADLTHLGIALGHANRADSGSFWVGVILAGRILPAISPQLVNEGKREFDLNCYLCGHDTLVRLRPPKEGDSDCLMAICPNCQCVIDLYGIDADGHYHRPSWFMRQFKPKTIDQPLEAWSFLLENCRNKHKRFGQHGGWQTAEETHRLLGGGTKDLAILLADWLGACGQDAKVVIGQIDGNPGVWVVLQADGHTYILDPAAGRRGSRRMPPRAELLTSYVPRLQFDWSGIWFRRSTGWTGQYRGVDQWWRGPWPLEPPPEETSNQTR